MSEGASTPEAADRGLGPVIDFATRVLAPASVLTAVLFYFGFVRERALLGYFGIDLGSVDLSTTDYLVRSAGTLFVPLATVLIAAWRLSPAISCSPTRWAWWIVGGDGSSGRRLA